MNHLYKNLQIKESTLPGAGLGLFTTSGIKKNTIITEYLGVVSSWKNADKESVYILYLNRNHVIDGRDCFLSLASFTNDAKGSGRIIGVRNNSYFEYDKLHVFIKALYHIPAGSEILTNYGKTYWKTK
jgi:hypothetical protein